MLLYKPRLVSMGQRWMALSTSCSQKAFQLYLVSFQAGHAGGCRLVLYMTVHACMHACMPDTPVNHTSLIVWQLCGATQAGAMMWESATASDVSVLTQLGSWAGCCLHLRQGRRVVIGDEVRPEEELRRQEALVLHAAGLLAAAPGLPEAVAPTVLLRGRVVPGKLLRSPNLLSLRAQGRHVWQL